MKPTIGRVVIYNTTEEQREAMRNASNCNVQDKLPAIIVAVWGESADSCVNLKVIGDGNEPDLWITSATRGDQEGNWNWPVMQQVRPMALTAPVPTLHLSGKLLDDFEKVWESIKDLFHKAEDDLAKASVFIVNDIQPVLFSDEVDILAKILDAVASSQLPTEILDGLRKWLPIFVTAVSIEQTLTPDSTEDEVKAALSNLLKLLPNLTAAQRAQYWTTLAAQIYVLVHELSTGQKITFGEAARIVETAYEAYIQTKNS